jgi:pimeloyl-ACP methyl ester carboxylesterase
MRERGVRELSRYGTALFHEETGGADRPLVLVHGWCCDHSYLSRQLEHFAARGHHVVAVDLRGHGQSDKPSKSYTMRAFADDVAWTCEELALEKPVLVGHSMGGIVAFDVAARYPQLPSGVVMLDAAVVLPSGAKDAISRFLGDLQGPAYREAQRRYVASALFIPTDDQRRKERILDDMSAAPQHVMVSAMEGLRDYDPAAVAGGLRVPALYVAADELQPRADMARFHELCPRLEYGKTVGSGHFCQLEVPDQINAMLDRFLAVGLDGDA